MLPSECTWVTEPGRLHEGKIRRYRRLGFAPTVEAENNSCSRTLRIALGAHDCRMGSVADSRGLVHFIPFTLALVTDNVLKVFLLALIAISFTWVYRSDRDRAIRRRLKELDDDDHKILAVLHQLNHSSYNMESKELRCGFLFF